MLPFRILALGILIVSLIADTDHFKFVMYPDMQLILGSVIVAILVFADVIVGLTLGFALFVLYIRVYADYTGIDVTWNSIFKPFEGKNESEYITPEHLKDAQNNVINSDNAPLIGFKDPYGEKVLSAQGMDSEIPGIDYKSFEDNWTPY